jgi:hypothetical protein
VQRAKLWQASPHAGVAGRYSVGKGVGASRQGDEDCDPECVAELMCGVGQAGFRTGLVGGRSPTALSVRLRSASRGWSSAAVFAPLSSWAWSATAGVDVLRIDGWAADFHEGRGAGAGLVVRSPALDSTTSESHLVFGFKCPVLGPGSTSFTGLTQPRAGCAIAM